MDDDIANMDKVKVVRLPERYGLIRARVKGYEESVGEVLFRAPQLLTLAGACVLG